MIKSDIKILFTIVTNKTCSQLIGYGCNASPICIKNCLLKNGKDNIKTDTNM